MPRLSIRELHMQTGHWVRKAQRSAVPIVITDRGRPIATLAPFDASRQPRPLPPRALLEKPLPKIDADSAEIVADMRDRS